MTKPQTRMTTRRRFLLGTLSGTIGGAITIGAYTLFGRSQLTAEQKTLRSIIDTIVPKDDFAGALDIGIDQAANLQMQSQPKTKEDTLTLIQSITQNSLSQYHKAFYKLNIDQREALLSKILERGSPQVTRNHLKRLRRFVLREFYTSKEGQASLNYQLPSHYPAYNNELATIDLDNNNGI